MATRVKQIYEKRQGGGSLVGDPYTAGDITTRVIIDYVSFTVAGSPTAYMQLLAVTGDKQQTVASWVGIESPSLNIGVVHCRGSDSQTAYQFNSQPSPPECYTGTGIYQASSAAYPTISWQIPSSFYVNGSTTLSLSTSGISSSFNITVSLICIGEY